MKTALLPFTPQSVEIDTLHKTGHVLFNLDQVKDFILQKENISPTHDLTAAQWLASDSGALARNTLAQLQSMSGGSMIVQMKTKNGVIFANKLACIYYLNHITDSMFMSKVGDYITMENLVDTDSYSISSPQEVKIELMPSDFPTDGTSELTNSNVKAHSRLNLNTAFKHSTAYLNQVAYRNIIKLINADMESSVAGLTGKFLSRLHDLIYNSILKNSHEELMSRLLKECGNPHSPHSGSPRDFFTAPVEEMFTIVDMEIARLLSTNEPFKSIEDFEDVCSQIEKRIKRKNLFRSLIQASGPNVTIMQKTYKSAVSQVVLTASGRLISRMIVS